MGNVGLNFAGDTGDNAHVLNNQTLTLRGGADTNALTEGNIGVVAQGNDQPLLIKLAKNLKDLAGVTVGSSTGERVSITPSGVTTYGMLVRL